ncbi:MAG: 4'-phosphopantetheinyl transferase superfamily protein [Flavobacteriales bacterium]
MPCLDIYVHYTGATIGLWKVEESISELECWFPDLIAGEKYRSFNHDLRKLEWLVARALMKEMGLSWSLSYSEHGKPYYPEGPKISLTHSKEYVAIITHSSNEVGIDVQEIVPKVERIKHKYCNAEELSWANSVEDYTLIWSAKEAMFKVKERNVNFSEDIAVSLVSDQKLRIAFKSTEVYSAHLLDLEGYKGVFMVG